MGRHKQSIDSITLEAIEQAISSIPNSSVVRKLTILSSYSRLKTEEIAKAFRINPRTLFRWISQFKDQGVEGLVDKPKGRKPALLTDEMKRQLVQWIETKKDSDGKEVSWTLDKLRAELEKVYSVKISKPALSVNLAKMNIRISELFPRISRQTRENRQSKKTLNYLKLKAEKQ